MTIRKGFNLSRTSLPIALLMLIIGGNLYVSASLKNPRSYFRQENRALVEQILRSPAKASPLEAMQTPLFQALETLAQTQGKDPKDYIEFRRDGSFSVLSHGYGVRVKVEQKGYVVVILSSAIFSVPGTSLQQLILLSEDGLILDKLTCDINSRYGETRTQIKQEPDSDGAQIVIVFEPNRSSSGWHNWHAINYAGHTSI